ncbi:hypothetical protein [Pseudomonas lurida]|jgi:hypothetical protein|uniref:hypothetical protein n=1 Tax=Pseudomonas lurida TaxID=244566 RepID=UPI0034D980B9
MSTGVKSTNSTILIGSADIVADVGFELVDSHLEIEDFQFLGIDTPDIHKVIEKLNLREDVPPELVAEALKLVRSYGSVTPLDGCRLKKWLLGNGFDLAYWSQIVIQFASYLPS